MKADLPGSPAPVATIASTPSATGGVDAFVYQPCPLCGKGTIIKGRLLTGVRNGEMDVLSGRISNLYWNKLNPLAVWLYFLPHYCFSLINFVSLVIFILSEIDSHLIE